MWQLQATLAMGAAVALELLLGDLEGWCMRQVAALDHGADKSEKTKLWKHLEKHVKSSLSLHSAQTTKKEEEEDCWKFSNSQTQTSPTIWTKFAMAINFESVLPMALWPKETRLAMQLTSLLKTP